jgi:hypothetical protein
LRFLAARPKAFEIVEGALLRREYVDDRVAEIDENPVAVGISLDA